MATTTLNIGRFQAVSFFLTPRRLLHRKIDVGHFSVTTRIKDSSSFNTWLYNIGHFQTTARTSHEYKPNWVSHLLLGYYNTFNRDGGLHRVTSERIGKFLEKYPTGTGSISYYSDYNETTEEFTTSTLDIAENRVNHIVVDASHNIYFAMTAGVNENNLTIIKKVDKDGDLVWTHTVSTGGIINGWKGLAVNPEGTALYYTSNYNKQITKINAATGAIDNTGGFPVNLPCNLDNSFRTIHYGKDGYIYTGHVSDVAYNALVFKINPLDSQVVWQHEIDGDHSSITCIDVNKNGLVAFGLGNPSGLNTNSFPIRVLNSDGTLKMKKIIYPALITDSIFILDNNDIIVAPTDVGSIGVAKFTYRPQYNNWLGTPTWLVGGFGIGVKYPVYSLVKDADDQYFYFINFDGEIEKRDFEGNVIWTGGYNKGNDTSLTVFYAQTPPADPLEVQEYQGFSIASMNISPKHTLAKNIKINIRNSGIVSITNSGGLNLGDIEFTN